MNFINKVFDWQLKLAEVQSFKDDVETATLR